MAWGPSEANGDRLMKRPPEYYHKPVGQSYEWMTRQVEDALSETGNYKDVEAVTNLGTTKVREYPAYGLVTDAQTEAEIASGANPSWQLWVVGEDGLLDQVPKRVFFDRNIAVEDYKAALAEERETFVKETLPRAQEISRPKTPASLPPDAAIGLGMPEPAGMAEPRAAVGTASGAGAEADVLLGRANAGGGQGAAARGRPGIATMPGTLESLRAPDEEIDLTADAYLKSQGGTAGLVEKGNIDLAARPVVKNKDGTISTVRSMSFEEDGKEVLIPTVSDDGRILSNKEAKALYRKTGKHLGKFNSVKAAEEYAQRLHEEQEAMYAPVDLTREAYDKSQVVQTPSGQRTTRKRKGPRPGRLDTLIKRQ
jgi:hypothetical protein